MVQITLSFRGPSLPRSWFKQALEQLLLTNVARTSDHKPTRLVRDNGSRLRAAGYQWNRRRTRRNDPEVVVSSRSSTTRTARPFGHVAPVTWSTTTMAEPRTPSALGSTATADAYRHLNDLAGWCGD